MIALDIQTIFGVVVGFEIADEEVREAFDLEWGCTFDFFILRLVLSKYKEE